MGFEEKLDVVLARNDELEALLGAGTGVDGETFVKLSKELAGLKDIVAAIQDYKKVLADMDGAQALLDDPETDAALARAAEHYRCIYGGESVVMKIPPVEISSTEIRRTLESGGIPHGIPDGVLDIIRDRGLYGYRK